MHAYLDWTKQRMDEMDAVLASLESKASQMQADTKVKAEPVIADLKKRRDAFRAQAKTQAEASVGALKEATAKLETQWNGFEAQVKTYFETVGKQVGQQQVTFREAAEAQAKAWGEAMDRFRGEAANVAEAKRSDIDAAMNQLKGHAKQANAALERVKQAGNESWTTLSAALAESRKNFDRATQDAWQAFRQSTAQKS
jgi:hypothetical protein